MPSAPSSPASSGPPGPTGTLTRPSESSARSRGPWSPSIPAERWRAAAKASVALYAGDGAVAFSGLAAEVATEVRLLRAVEDELAHHAEAREDAYRRVDPEELARSLPGIAEVGGPVLQAVVGRAHRFEGGSQFNSFTGLPKASETGETDRKGQPMSRPDPRCSARSCCARPTWRARSIPSSPRSTARRWSSEGPTTSRPWAWSPRTWRSGPGRCSPGGRRTSSATPTGDR